MRKRTSRKTSEVVEKTILQLLDNRTDSLIEKVCKKNRINEQHIRKVGGWEK